MTAPDPNLALEQLDPGYVEGIGYVIGADLAHRYRDFPEAPVYLEDMEPCIICGALYGACSTH